MTMDERVLLCTDMDGTIIPNGSCDDSPASLALLRRIAARPEMTLVYVTGRHRQLIAEAITEYELPEPDHAVGDVGTSIYRVAAAGGGGPRGAHRGRDDLHPEPRPRRHGREAWESWESWESWEREIAAFWGGRTHDDVERLVGDIPGLRLQEPEKQNKFKLSYYAPVDLDGDALVAKLGRRLRERGVRAAVIWSVDESAGRGLLDILPEGATKLHAIRFVMAALGFPLERTVFAGDSGNDLPALGGGLQAVLVGNASDDVRRLALAKLAENGVRRDRLYLAGGGGGGFRGLNGCYAAGVLEGLAHFLPWTERWLS